MPESRLSLDRPAAPHCETKVQLPTKGATLRMECGRPASFVYGPACEEETGKLMYLCDEHAQLIKDWRASNLWRPVDCPTHGRIGRVKDSLTMKEI